MAKFLSQIMTIARGSVGGVTFTANQFQQLIMRAKTCPVNPSTLPQAWIRTALASASQHWNLLTEAQRTAWNDYAATLLYTGPLGTYTLPGRQVMVGNLSLVLYGNNLLGTPLTPSYLGPTAPGFSAFEAVKTAEVSVGTGVAVSVSNNCGENMHALVERSVAFNPARERFKGPFLSSTAQYVPVPDPTTVLVEFDGLDEGAAYFMRVRGVTTEGPHRITSETILRMIATAVV